MKQDRTLVLMFWAWVGGVTCDQAVMQGTEGNVVAAIVWVVVGVALAAALTVMYRRT